MLRMLHEAPVSGEMAKEGGITLMFEVINHLVLQYPFGQKMLYWNIPTGRMFCTGIFLLMECFVIYP